MYLQSLFNSVVVVRTFFLHYASSSLKVNLNMDLSSLPVTFPFLLLPVYISFYSCFLSLSFFFDRVSDSQGQSQVHLAEDDLNSCSSCLYLSSAGITDMVHCIHLQFPTWAQETCLFCTKTSLITRTGPGTYLSIYKYLLDPL